MKKIIQLYIAFLAGLLFFYSYDSYNYIHFLKIQELDNGMNLNGEKGDFYQLVWKSDDLKQRQATLSSIVEYARSQGIAFVASCLMPTDNGMYLFHYYVQSDDDQWIYNRLNMLSGKTIDFSDASTQSYLSSIPDDSGAAGIFASYDRHYFDSWKQELRIYQAAMLPQCDSNEISFIFDTADHSNIISAWISEHLNDTVSFDQEAVDVGSDHDIETSYQNDDIRLALTSSLLILVLLLLCLSLKNKHEIMICKMLGHSTLYIVLRLYIRFLCGLLVLFSAMFGLLCLIITPTFSPYYGELYQDIIHYIRIGALTIPLLLITVFAFIKTAIHISDLKNTASLQWVSGFNITFKIILSCAMLVPFVTSINRLIPNAQHYLFLQQHGKDISSLYTFSHFDGRREELQELYDEIIYFDMSDYTHLSNRHAYSYYGLSNADLGFPPQPLPLLYVNKTYLKKTNMAFTDTQGKAVDLEALQDKTYLIPTAQKNIEPPEDGTVIYVQSTGSHVDLQAGILGKFNEPILVVYARFNGMNVYQSNMFFDQGDRKMIESMIDKVTDSSYLLHAQRSLVSRVSIDALNAMVSSGASVVMFGMLYGLFILQFCYLTIEQYKKELALAYAAGKSRWERYGPMVFILLAAYLATMLIGITLLRYPLSICMEFFILGFLFDVSCFSIFIRYAETHTFLMALKGGD